MTIAKRNGNSSPRDMGTSQFGAVLNTEDERAAARRTLAQMTVRIMPGASPADRQWRALQLREMLGMLGLADVVKHPEDPLR